ncbi:hypothetical protein BKP45_04970 [Anaerobacillus alkalidiazotrophicus]|uniref:Restriction endonuclease type IV Mrr domain-containing protein n=1 Tax=Anaerobacillus alkalidiazotrophicus TaxID=472963 RepID=A0A1S2MB93_9BACI|nr:restriction endonuclease [Anaerobacillus alkalidiazotrophicus]OIJ22032.1 hypothetical protein BKP45_04970 [Anaerobacillus alkalidiazotrophicus]
MRKDLREIIRLIITFGGLYWFFMHSSMYWPHFVVILVAASLLPNLLIIPKKKKSSKSRTANAKKTSGNSKKTKTPTKAHNLLRSENEILTLPFNELSWREFERLCYLYYKAKGFKPRETSEGADGGVDLIIFSKEHNANVAVQIKHYKGGKPIGVEPIRELNSAKRNHNCSLADFITTSSFTNAALLQADKFKIDTHDKNWVENNILKWRDQEARKRKLA